MTTIYVTHDQVEAMTLAKRASDQRTRRLSIRGQGLFDATVYAAELTGDVTLVTIHLGKDSLSVKMPKEYDVDFDSTVAVRFPLDRGFLFDAATGERLNVGFAAASAA